MGFWNFPNTVELISNVGIIFFSNVLYLLKSDYRDDDVVGSFTIYYLWGMFCFMKFIKMHKILMGFTDYEILVKTCLDVIPIVIDLLKIYLIVLIFYGTLGMFLFGGVMNTKFLGVFEELTGDELDEEMLMFNFNDIINSIIFFFNMNLAGYIENIQIGLVAWRAQNSSDFKLLMMRFYFYSFLIITEFVILNVIVGFICDFMGVYQGNNEE